MGEVRNQANQKHIKKLEILLYYLKNKKGIKDKAIIDIQKLFETEKEKAERKKLDKTNIRAFFEQEKEKDYYKPKRVCNFSDNSYIKYENNGDKIETYHYMNISI